MPVAVLHAYLLLVPQADLSPAQAIPKPLTHAISTYACLQLDTASIIICECTNKLQKGGSGQHLQVGGDAARSRVLSLLGKLILQRIQLSHEVILIDIIWHPKALPHDILELCVHVLQMNQS